MKRKSVRVCALGLVIICALSGCAPLVEDAEDELVVYASFYPIYALASMIINDDVPDISLNQLVQPQDGCVRSYQLSDWDAALALKCDALIMGGRGLESFHDAFLALGEGAPAVVSVMSALKLETYAAYDSAEDTTGHFAGDNPWLYLSVEGAQRITEVIASAMATLDEPWAHIYISNLASARDRLEALTNDMRALYEGADTSIPVALMHEGLDYVAAEAGLNVVCRIARESASEPSDTQIESIMTALSDSGAQLALIEKQAPASLKRALESEGFVVCLIDTLSTGRQETGADGYITAMLNNAREIRRALDEVSV